MIIVNKKLTATRTTYLSATWVEVSPWHHDLPLEVFRHEIAGASVKREQIKEQNISKRTGGYFQTNPSESIRRFPLPTHQESSSYYPNTEEENTNKSSLLSNRDWEVYWSIRSNMSAAHLEVPYFEPTEHPHRRCQYIFKNEDGYCPLIIQMSR